MTPEERDRLAISIAASPSMTASEARQLAIDCLTETADDLREAQATAFEKAAELVEELACRPHGVAEAIRALKEPTPRSTIPTDAHNKE